MLPLMSTWKYVVASVVIVSLFSIEVTSALADGALDWADPCVKGEKTFKSNSDAARDRADQAIQEWDKRVEPPGELRGHYVQAIREGAYKTWSENPSAAPLLAAMKASNPNFDAQTLFLTQVYPKVITPEIEAEYVRALYKTDYQGKLRPELIKAKTDLETQIASEKQKMDASCKKDVLLQVLRGTIGNALALLGNNWSAAQNERGDVAKFFRLTSGISIEGIQQHGIRGGPNSEMSKLLGSDKSVASQVVQALDPTKWQVEFPNLPKINLPNIPPSALPKIDGPPTMTLPGDVKVCIPWC